MLTSLDTPAGHGHIYEDELVPLWAAVMKRKGAPITEIIEAIRESVTVLRKPRAQVGAESAPRTGGSGALGGGLGGPGGSGQ